MDPAVPETWAKQQPSPAETQSCPGHMCPHPPPEQWTASPTLPGQRLHPSPGCAPEWTLEKQKLSNSTSPKTHSHLTSQILIPVPGSQSQKVAELGFELGVFDSRICAFKHPVSSTPQLEQTWPEQRPSLRSPLDLMFFESLPYTSQTYSGGRGCQSSASSGDQ